MLDVVDVLDEVDVVDDDTEDDTDDDADTADDDALQEPISRVDRRFNRASALQEEMPRVDGRLNRVTINELIATNNSSGPTGYFFSPNSNEDLQLMGMDVNVSVPACTCESTGELPSVNGVNDLASCKTCLANYVKKQGVSAGKVVVGFAKDETLARMKKMQEMLSNEMAHLERLQANENEDSVMV